MHLSEAGLPILGDPIYAHRKAQSLAPRLCLHACELGFTHPRTGEAMLFKVPWAPELKSLAEKMGFKNV